MYKVVETFADRLDYNHIYHKGDTFPRDNRKVSDKRIEELKTKNNRLGIPIIVEVVEESEKVVEKPAKAEEEKPKAKKKASK